MTRLKINEPGWQLGALLCGIAVTAIFLCIPTPRQFGLSLRYDFLPVILPLSLLIFLLFQLPDRLSRLVLFTCISAILTLPIAGLWFSGQSEQYLLGGIIPFSDARSYFTDARRLLEGAPFITGASRRPLFTAMLTSIQWLAGQNLYISIAVLTLILGISMYFAVQEFRSSEGSVAATLFLILLFCYARLLLGKTLSEFLGLPGGLLALVFLLRGISRNELKFMLLALVTLSLALNARAGAFFILPMIALWIGRHFREKRSFNWRYFLFACATIAVGFLVNTAVFKLYSSSESAPFGNFSFTIYGLARGGLGWTQIFTDHPETYAMPAREQAELVYGYTWQIIQRKPMNLVNGILSSYRTFFSLDDYYGSIGWFGGQGIMGNISRIGFYLLLVAGLVFCVKDRKKPLRSIYLYTFLGIFLSIPFAPPIDSNRMRVYAATLPFFIAVPSIGLSSLCNFLPWKIFKTQEHPVRPLLLVYGLGIILVLCMTIIPALPYHFSAVDTSPAMICSEGLKPVSFRVLPGNHLRIIDQDAAPQDSVPIIRNKTFANRIHNLPNWETYTLFSDVKPGQVILVDLDLQTKDPMILIADWDKVGRRSGVQTVCSRPSGEYSLREYNVYFAEEYQPE